MLNETEKDRLLNWQQWKHFYDVMTEMDVRHLPTIEGYYKAVDQLVWWAKGKKGEERIVGLVKAAYEEMPDAEMTLEALETELKPWKARTETAQKELLTITFEFGDRTPSATDITQ
jgi:hypothetical protein